MAEPARGGILPFCRYCAALAVFSNRSKLITDDLEGLGAHQLIFGVHDQEHILQVLHPDPGVDQVGMGVVTIDEALLAFSSTSLWASSKLPALAASTASICMERAVPTLVMISSDIS